MAENIESDNVWICSSDRKYVLTWGDKVHLETMMRTYCPNTSFDEDFKKVLEKNYKYAHEVLIDFYQVYISHLNKISDDFQKAIESFPGEFEVFECKVSESLPADKREALKSLPPLILNDPTDPAILKHHSKVFRMSRYKLEWTYYEALEFLYTNSSDESSLQDVWDKKARSMSESMEIIMNKLDKIDRQTENRQNEPEWIQLLVAKGYLLSDGITTLTGLPNIVECLYSNQVENVTPEMLERFKRRNGKPYSLGTRIEAVKNGKPPSCKKKTKKK